jgi:type IV pilus assembly protein PilF
MHRERIRIRAAAQRALLLLSLGGVGTLPLLSLGCAKDQQAEDNKLGQVSAHYDLGVDYLQGGNSAMAVRELQAALALDEAQPRVHHAIAEAFRVTGRLPDCEAHLQRALALQPAFQGARLSLSALYIQMDRYEDAIRESQVLASDPTFAAPWRALTNVGWAQYKLGRKDEARATLTQALAMRHDYWPALLNLGILESQDGHRAAAIDSFAKVLATNPGASAEAETNYRLAEIYVAMGERDRALSHLSTVIERQPQGEWGKRSQEYRKLLQ